MDYTIGGSTVVIAGSTLPFARQAVKVIANQLGGRSIRGSLLKTGDFPAQAEFEANWHLYMGFKRIRGALFGAPYNKDYSIWGVYIRVPLYRETTNYSHYANSGASMTLKP